MSISAPFIRRPIGTSLLAAALLLSGILAFNSVSYTHLLMVGVLLVGWVAFLQLPVSALPEVDYPTIEVVTFYPGADPDVCLLYTSRCV